MSAPDLDAAASAVDLARDVVQQGLAHVAATGSVDADQVVAYDLAHAAAAVETARTLLDYGAKGDEEATITVRVRRRRGRRRGGQDLRPRGGVGRRPRRARRRPRRSSPPTATPSSSPSIEGPGPRHLDDDFEMVQDTFRRFAEDKIRPVAEHIHRHNDDIPEDVIGGLAEIGAFGLSVPEEYGGFAAGGESDYMGMVVATEELSRGSLGVGGSLITRPEILTRALVKGGTEEQKQQWLPRLASAEVMAAVAVTEPDFGSDVAGIKVTATKTDGGWLINGVKTWCTFGARATVLMLLARTDPDRSKTHRGLSLFVVPKPGSTGTASSSPRRRAPTAAPRRREDGGPADRHDRLPRACTPTRSRSTTGSSPTTTSSAARTAWARASTCRWPGSRTAGCRPRPAPSA